MTWVKAVAHGNVVSETTSRRLADLRRGLISHSAADSPTNQANKGEVVFTLVGF